LTALDEELEEMELLLSVVTKNRPQTSGITSLNVQKERNDLRIGLRVAVHMNSARSLLLHYTAELDGPATSKARAFS
jgi:hypothetical protein